jgi:predicted HTH transcriptional regulator
LWRIARFFKEIGRADELGSGVRKLYRYTRIYSGGADPQLMEDDVFKIIIPTVSPNTEQRTTVPMIWKMSWKKYEPYSGSINQSLQKFAA